MLSLVIRPVIRPGIAAARHVAALTCLLMLAACCGPVRAGDTPPVAVPDDAASEAARTLVDEVLRGAGGNDGESLGAWSRSVVERALDRAAGASGTSPAPLPAERHAARTAAGLAGRPNSAGIIVFTSLSVPARSWRQWASEAARIGAPLVLRGVAAEGMRATVKRIGDRIRWTRNDIGLGLVNSQTAEVAEVRGGTVTFRLEDGRMLDLQGGDAQLRHVDRAWASTVHAFQGRTVDTVIAAMEANHPNLTTQKTLYVEIRRARDRAELVTDDKAALQEQLEAATGERIAALEAVEPDRAKGHEAGSDAGRSAGREAGASSSQERERSSGREMESARTPKSLDRDLGL